MNQNLFNRTLHKGFTLVELLIVVIILSILAAIALPQFTSGTDDARLAALDTTLGNMRAVIDLYAQQHNGQHPGNVAATGGALCGPPGAPPAAGAAQSLDAFIAQLTMYTNAQGQACTAQLPGFDFGPYLKKNIISNNPVTGSNDLAITSLGVLGITGVSPPKGWAYDTLTGQFIANDSSFIPPGTAAPDPTYDQL